MARNRKRAKERRARRPQPVGTTRTERDDAPSPIRHAAPDAELAEAQMAVGRPELSGSSGPEDAFDDEELELESGGGAGAGGTGAANGAGFGGDAPPPSGGELAVPSGAAAAERQRTASRLINFLQGSWRELQRVQWPDRRQVMQATGVVIGFVIVAGIFLGVADTVATQIMKYILNQ